MPELKGCPHCHNFSETEDNWNNHHTNPYHNQEEGRNEKKYICPACQSQLNLENLETVV